MGLREYQDKRDFAVTPEPRGAEHPDAGGSAFVIQKHAARQLHYDLRLELDGVLKSWAVPKGPSLDPAEKRLAVPVEDHPLEYGGFEGVIPKGQYGGGTVLLWDRGRWYPRGDPHEGLRRGSLHFRLEGEKLRGGWHLVRTREDAWLLVREGDPAEGALGDRSVATGRTMEEVARDRDRVWRTWPGKRAPAPVGLEPALCTPATTPPAGEGWIHELKLDGYRALAWLRDGKATIRTRGGKDWTARFGELAAALEALPVRDAVLDGEIVAVSAAGVPDFGALQRWLGDRPGEAGPVRVVYYAFDLPWVEGHDLRDTPLVSRKESLSTLLSGTPPPLRYMDHVSGRGPEFFAEACARGLEGSIAKRADSPYPVGRSRDWIKVKCPREARLRVVGWTDPGGTRSGFGALLLAREDGGRLRYAGRVGTGFDARALDQLPPRLRARSTPPVEDPPHDTRGVHWVEPDLLADVSFTEETNEGLLRHPVFLRISETAPARVRLTHPDRVLWPDVGVTKRELAAWYAAAGARALPHLAGRPLTLLRCPDGEGKPCFYQRHFLDTLPAGIRGVRVPGRDETYLAIDGMEGLLGLAQMGVLEIHPWGARADAPDRPDRLVFDLDPDPALPWSRLVDAALAVRDRLEAAGLRSFARLTGGKGVHVVVPLAPPSTWEVARAFCRKVAEDVARREPARYTSKMAKSERRGRVFVDWLRNALTATAVGSYSTRARPGAPVAMPVTWEELAEAGRGDRYDVRSGLARLDAPDPWPDLAGVRQALG